MSLYTGTRQAPAEFVWPSPRIEFSTEQKIRFGMTLMYRAVFYNRAMLDMATVSLGKLIEGNKEPCKLLAAVYELCQIQGQIEDSVEIDAAMKALDNCVARLLLPPDPERQPFSFIARREAEKYRERADERYRGEPTRLSNDIAGRG